jgi:peptide/nickel transport system substrate-binding protein
LLILATFLVTCGCGNQSRGQADEPSTLTLLLDQDETLMRPALDEEEKFLVFLPMAKQREDGELEGRLARSWERSEDNRIWTYHLRTDVRWHDGVPVTAQDVVFTMKLLSDSAVAYYPPGAVTAAALDDSTVVFEYARESAMNPVTTTWWTSFLPRHLLEDLDTDSPKTMMELEANPDYYAGSPAVQQVVLRFGPSNLLELRAGKVDVVPYVGASEALALTTNPEFRVYHSINGLHGRLLVWDPGSARDPPGHGSPGLHPDCGRALYEPSAVGRRPARSHFVRHGRGRTPPLRSRLG